MFGTELINDDYVYGKKKVQVKTKTTNGMTYTTTGVLGPGTGGALAGDLACKYNLSGAQMTTKLLTAGNMTHEMVLENTGVNGLKLTVNGGIGPKQTLVATGEYVHPHLSAVLKANCIGSPSVVSALAVGMHGVTAGAQATFDVEKKEVTDVEGVVNYSKSPEHEATVALLAKATSAKFVYSHVVSPDFSVAGEFLYDITNDSKVLTMGSKYEVDGDTTLKSKITSGGELSLCYVQKIMKNATLTLCSRFDVGNLEKPLEQFGLSLVLE